MKTTVTDSGASVASPASIDEALETGILPRDPHYLRTGKFADEKPGADNRAEESETDDEEQLENEVEEQEHDENEEQEENEEQDPAASGVKDGDTAAASRAAETQKGKNEMRTGGESRWAKLSRENRELREREARRDREIAELRSKVDGTATRDTSQASQPAAAAAAAVTPARPEPKIDDVDDKGKAKYADYAAWQRDLRKWDREQAVAEFQATNSKTERDRQQQQAQQTIAREWQIRTAAAEKDKDMPDFKKVALNPDLPVKAGSVVDFFILDSPIGTKVLYHLGKNPTELDRINGLNPLAQARELTKLELKLSGSSSSSSPARPSQAPRPPHQVSGKGTVSKDAAEDAVERKSQKDYAQVANERDPRLLAVRRARKQA